MNHAPTDDAVYLREQTKIEPLVCRWYAWSHLVSPVQQALNIVYRYLPALKSFITNPRAHITALRDSTVFAGPYLNLSQEYVVSARELLDETLHRCAPIRRLAEDIISFDRQLQSCATGSTLDPLYAMIPASLKGLVELTYNLNNRPSFRIFESILDDGELHFRNTSEVGFSTALDEERRYFLNTPRLDKSQSAIRLPFDSTAFDSLSQARISPTSFASLAESIGLPATREGEFRRFFTDSPPYRKDSSYTGPSFRVRYFGHACVLVQTSDTSILIDPLVSWDRRSGDDSHLTFNDLPDFIDYVFLSHSHQDHFYPEIFLQLRGRIGTILVPRNNPHSLADPSMKYALAQLGHHKVEVMDSLDSVSIPDGRITSIPFYGEHADLDILGKHCMHLEVKDHRFMFVVDSDYKTPFLYKQLTYRLGKTDTLFIGMECEGAPLNWLYHPYLTTPVTRKDAESRRLAGSNCARAWDLVQECGCQEVFIYAMGQEPWLKYIIGLQYEPNSKQIVESNLLVDRCREAGISARRLYGCETIMY